MPRSYWNVSGDHLYVACRLLLMSTVFVSLASAEDGKSELPPPLVANGSDATKRRTIGVSTSFEETLLGVRLNGQNLSETILVLQRKDGRVLISGKDLARWRIHRPESPAETYQNEPYYFLDVLGSVTHRVEVSAQLLQVDVSPENFLPSVFNAFPSAVESPRMPSAGGFFNYDISARHSQGESIVGTQLEMGIFGGGGVGTTQMLARDLSNPTNFIRLESTWTMDRPERLASLRLGDALSQGGLWSRPMRFAGIQWSTNFATQPNFITFPLPSISGQTAVLSTAEVFINNVLTYQSDIQAGPFSFRQLPVMTGRVKCN